MLKKICMIDDDEDLLNIFKLLLEEYLSKSMNIEVITENKGTAALKLIKSHKPDIIILDIELPKISGMKICQQLRKLEQFKQTPIVAFSGVSKRKKRRKILKTGFDIFIPKTIKPKKFAQKIKKLLLSRNLND